MKKREPVKPRKKLVKRKTAAWWHPPLWNTLFGCRPVAKLKDGGENRWKSIT
jgi:hypothetical protein